MFSYLYNRLKKEYLVYIPGIPQHYIDVVFSSDQSEPHSFWVSFFSSILFQLLQLKSNGEVERVTGMERGVQ